MKKIHTIDLDLTRSLTEENYEEAKKKYTNDYNKRRAEFIAEYKEYVPGHSTGLFGWKSGEYVLRPDIGEAKWNAKPWEKTWEQNYPEGFTDWKKDNGHVLTSAGQQTLIDKINEIIDHLNAKTPSKKKG